MASPEFALTVTVSPTATAELADIWQWNADRYGAGHADEYVGFLRNTIRQLPVLHKLGRPVTVQPNLRYLVIRRRAKGHGHIAVYRCDEKAIDVLHVFHTAQDWQAILSGETPSQ
jgi:plasmid stabilization system protein ParE